MKRSVSADVEQGIGPLHTMVTEMSGTMPDVPLPPDIDVEELRKIYGEDLEFVTLPIGEVGVTSRNGHTYHRSSIESLVDQVNTKRPEGMWGHYDPWEISFKYEPPAVRWLAAQLESDGKAYAKLVPLTEDAKIHFKGARATGARVGSSIYGVDVATNENDEIVYFRLLTIDIANSERVGVPSTAAQVKLSREMDALGEAEEQPVDPKEQRTDTVVELEAQVEDLRQRNSSLAKRVRELERVRDTAQAVRELFEVSDDGDLLAAAQAYIEEGEQLRQENRVLLAETVDAMIAAKVKIEDARAIIRELVMERKPATKKAIDQAVEAVLARESVKQLLKGMVQEQSGPPVNVTTENPLGTEAWKQYVEIPEE